LCTASLNFSSSRNCRMRNTSSLLRDDMAAPIPAGASSSQDQINLRPSRQIPSQTPQNPPQPPGKPTPTPPASSKPYLSSPEPEPTAAASSRQGSPPIPAARPLICSCRRRRAESSTSRHRQKRPPQLRLRQLGFGRAAAVCSIPQAPAVTPPFLSLSLPTFSFQKLLSLEFFSGRIL
jgi:hypothetical protein